MIILDIFNFLNRLTTGAKLALAGIILMFFLILAFGYVIHQKNVLEKQVEAEKAERKRVEQQNEGLKILANTANLAIEIAKEKEKANEQANISKNANAEYANSRHRDSNSYSNSFTEARRNYCREYPADSLCAR